MPRVIALMNAYTQGISGGDTCFIELAKRMGEYDKIVVTSLLGKKLCDMNGLEADYLVTTKEEHFENAIFTYCQRILKVFLLRIEASSGDVVYATSDFLPDVLPAFCLKMRNKDIKWIQKVFHLIPSRRFIPYFTQKISHFFIKRFADLIIVDNILLKDDLARLGFDAERIEVNPPGVDLKYFRSVAEDATTYDSAFLGRLHASKGVFELVEIWKRICEVRPKATLAIIGYGNRGMERDLGRRIEDARLGNNIHVLGYLEKDRAFGLIKAAKSFVFPSFEEGFGMAICEAMACGVPVIAWDLPVYKELFPKGIILVPTGDIRDFADRVIGLLDNGQMLQRMAEEAIMTASRYDWDVIAERERACVQSVIKQPGGSR